MTDELDEGTVYGIRPHRPMSAADHDLARRLAEHRPISEHHHAGQLCPLGSGCVQPSGDEPLRWPFVDGGA